jgi:hypothetical protein
VQVAQKFEAALAHRAAHGDVARVGANVASDIPDIGRDDVLHDPTDENGRGGKDRVPHAAGPGRERKQRKDRYEDGGGPQH